jgi:CheY-like chemotaxis protein
MANETILVVEDTELLRKMYSDKLAADGFRVVQAGDGLTALTLARSESVDLILLDLILPRMGGIETLDALKKDPRTARIPVVVLTNIGNADDIDRVLALGAVDYLIKNQAKPADVSAKIALTLGAGRGAPVAEAAAPAAAGAATPDAVPIPGATPHAADGPTYRLALRDREADADAFIGARALKQRLWCPACQEELVVELIARSDRDGWYDAHVICPSCGKQF